MEAQAEVAAPAKPAAKSAVKSTAPTFSADMPLMSSAFDTAGWLVAA
jgi:hypothetical protein